MDLPTHAGRIASRRTWLARLREETGAELLEFLGIFVFVLISALIVWQVFLLGYTAYVASSAAREGARALAVGGDCYAAASNASFNWEESKRRINCEVRGNVVVATVTLQVFKTEFPLIGELPGYPWVSSQATARNEPRPR